MTDQIQVLVFMGLILVKAVSTQLPIYQCNNCRASPDCEQENILGSVVYDTAKECEDRCRATGDQCEMADYNVKLGTCKIYTCTEVQEVYGYTAFRRSSNPVCSPLMLATYEKTGGAISCKLTSTTTSNIECINVCMETENCSAIDFSSTTCTLYSSSERVTNTQTRFTNVVCQKEKLYMQTCLNCNQGSQCGTHYTSESKLDCDSRCDSDENCKLAVLYYNGCRMFDCSFLQTASTLVAYRKSPIDDCLVFEISSISAHSGICAIMEIRYNIPNQDYCFAICLDTSGCRAITYEGIPDTCKLHECVDKEAQSTGAYIFIQRTCLDATTTATSTTPVQTTTDNIMSWTTMNNTLTTNEPFTISDTTTTIPVATKSATTAFESKQRSLPPTSVSAELSLATSEVNTTQSTKPSTRTTTWSAGTTHLSKSTEKATVTMIQRAGALTTKETIRTSISGSTTGMTLTVSALSSHMTSNTTGTGTHLAQVTVKRRSCRSPAPKNRQIYMTQTRLFSAIIWMSKL